MECPRGMMCTESDHQVKTLAKAQEWSSLVKPIHLPITVNQNKGAGGRIMVRIYGSNGQLLETRG